MDACGHTIDTRSDDIARQITSMFLLIDVGMARHAYAIALLEKEAAVLNALAATLRNSARVTGMIEASFLQERHIDV